MVFIYWAFLIMRFERLSISKHKVIFEKHKRKKIIISKKYKRLAVEP